MRKFRHSIDQELGNRPNVEVKVQRRPRPQNLQVQSSVPTGMPLQSPPDGTPLVPVQVKYANPFP